MKGGSIRKGKHAECPECLSGNWDYKDKHKARTNHTRPKLESSRFVTAFEIKIPTMGPTTWLPMITMKMIVVGQLLYGSPRIYSLLACPIQDLGRHPSTSSTSGGSSHNSALSFPTRIYNMTSRKHYGECTRRSGNRIKHGQFLSLAAE